MQLLPAYTSSTAFSSVPRAPGRAGVEAIALSANPPSTGRVLEPASWNESRELLLKVPGQRAERGQGPTPWTGPILITLPQSGRTWSVMHSRNILEAQEAINGRRTYYQSLRAWAQKPHWREEKRRLPWLSL